MCSTSGMHLATITSLAQMTLLKEKSRTMPFQKCKLLTKNTNQIFLIFWLTLLTYTCKGAWIGGRDALTVSQFAWEFNKESLNTSIVSLFEHQAGVRTCLCFNPYNNLTIAVDCVTNRNVMCELIYGKWYIFLICTKTTCLIIY